MKALCGRILHFTGDPTQLGEQALGYWPNGALLIAEDGRIAGLGEPSIIPEGTPIERFDHHLIMPGLIDTHLHFPQTQVIGSYGAQLLDWLQTYTFVEEQRFADEAHCAVQAELFLDELIRNGTTTAAVYGSVHPQSIDALMAGAQARQMALIAGKSIMDRNAPPGLLDTPERGYQETKSLIQRWHGQDRLHYAITCRFAITSTDAQMHRIGQLVAEHPECYVQTHLSENHAEIATVAELFPDRLDYTDVYEHFGLLGPKTLLGHCIHLSARERQRLAATGSIACFCPTSNLFIGSGLFDLSTMRQANVPVTLATDIGGGTSYSMLVTAAEGYKVLQLQNMSWPALDAFHTMTRGNAKALGLDHEIGTLEPGSMADIAIFDLAATPALANRLAREPNCGLGEQLFALMMMGDDRAVGAVYVAGVRVK